MDYINKCLKYIDKNLKESRKQHTFGVVETAKQLAAAYNQDVSKAETAALFHDIAKPLSAEESDEEVRKFNIGQELLIDTELELCFRKKTKNNIAFEEGWFNDLFLKEDENTIEWKGNLKSLIVIPRWRIY